jgi:hypothetical protein
MHDTSSVQLGTARYSFCVVKACRICMSQLFVLCCSIVGIFPAYAMADSPLTTRSEDIGSIWQEVWGRSYVSDASAMLVIPASGGVLQVQEVIVDIDSDRDPRHEMITVAGRGSYDRLISAHLSSLAPTSDELAEWDLESLELYAVAVDIYADSLNFRYLVGIEIHLVFPDMSEGVVFTPTSVEMSAADAMAQQIWVTQVLTATVPAFNAVEELEFGQVAPPGHAPPAAGTVWCYCSTCYLDCLDQSNCDSDYIYCTNNVCDPIHQVCMAGASEVYAFCKGNCPCSGSPSFWCSARCYGCAINLGFQQGLCWAARLGCLSGCELAKTACYSGCYLGSWFTYSDPPGCP